MNKWMAILKFFYIQGDPLGNNIPLKFVFIVRFSFFFFLILEGEKCFR